MFANSVEFMFAADDFDESKIKRKGKGTGGGQFASKGGAKATSKSAGKSGKSEGKSAAPTKPEIPAEITKIIADYHQVFPQTYKRFADAAGNFGEVAGRVKAADSIAKKLAGRYAGRKVTDLGDVIAFRCTSRSVKDVYASAEAVKDQFKILEIDDKMPEGQGFYRALHITIDSLDDTGTKRAEIQLRTVRQSNIAQWGHDIAYKGQFAKDPEVLAYARKVSEANWELDNGRHAKMPDPPEILKKHGVAYDADKSYDDFWLAREHPELAHGIDSNRKPPEA